VKGKDHSIIAAALIFAVLIFLILAATFGIVVFKQINPGKFTLLLIYMWRPVFPAGIGLEQVC